MKRFCQIGIGESSSCIDLLNIGWGGMLVEMHPYSFSRLVSRVYDECSKEELARLHLLNVAIRGSDGFDVLQTGEMFQIDHWCGLESSNKDNDRFNTSERFRSNDYLFKVYGISLSTLLANVPIDLLVMDIQGSEIDVLSCSIGNFLPFPRLIDVECHSSYVKDRIHAFLCNAGYLYIRTKIQDDDVGRPNDLFEYKPDSVLGDLSYEELRIIGI